MGISMVFVVGIYGVWTSAYIKRALGSHLATGYSNVQGRRFQTVMSTSLES